MRSARSRSRRPLVCAALSALLVAAALFLAPAPAVAAASAPPRAAAHLTLDGFVFESGQPISGQLLVRNDGGGWLKTEDLGDITGALRLTLPNGEEVRPSGADLFGAARAKEIGAGGFVGVTFDLLKLFPAATKEGTYRLSLKRRGLPVPQVSFKVIPAFDPTQSYRLLLNTPDGELAIDLTREAPASVRALISLVRTGYFEKAAIGALRPGFALSIVSPQPSDPRIEPFEKTARELLAGTVVLDPGGPDSSGAPTFNNPSLIVLLAPRPDWQGRVTAIGQLAGGDETLTKLTRRPTSGEQGLPPWKPVAPLTVESMRVVEIR